MFGQRVLAGRSFLPGGLRGANRSARLVAGLVLGVVPTSARRVAPLAAKATVPEVSGLAAGVALRGGGTFPCFGFVLACLTLLPGRASALSFGLALAFASCESAGLHVVGRHIFLRPPAYAAWAL